MKILELFFGLFGWLDLLTPNHSESKEENIKKIQSYSRLTCIVRLTFELSVLLAIYTLVLLWLLQSAFNNAILVWMICALTWLLLIGLSQVYDWASIRFVSNSNNHRHKEYIRKINLIGFALMGASFAYTYYLG